jgi:hypothetical protein
MTRQSVVLMTIGSVAAVSSTIATGLMWVLLTNPLAVADAAVAHGLAGSSHVASAVLYDMLLQLVHAF